MGEIFFTSDTHFGHARIIELSGRPFADVAEMNDAIVERWNSVVSPDDTVYHLGDVALGPIMDSLANIARLNGRIVLIDGNHDRRFMAKNDAQRERWEHVYLEAGFAAIYPNLVLYNMDPLPAVVNLSHFPYEGDSHDGDRFESKRFKDQGIPLIHGHTHSTGDPISWTSRELPGKDDDGEAIMVPAPTLQIHVGMDAWDFTPVHAEVVAGLISGALG